MQWGVGRGLPFLAPRVNYALTNCVYRYTETAHGISARLCRPVDNLLITGGRFPQILDLFRVQKIGVPSGRLGETSIFKIVTSDDVTLWSKLESYGESTRFC